MLARSLMTLVCCLAVTGCSQDASEPASEAPAAAAAAPAPTLPRPNTGHHHLIVDSELASMATPIPADAQHIHFGGGQTEATVELSAGEHVLQLALGDYLHIPHDPPLLSDPVTVQVVE
jgi:hypothetical protein